MSNRNEAKYNEEMKRLETNLAKLQAQLQAHKEGAAKENHNWGWIGDLQHYNSVLEQITNQED